MDEASYAAAFVGGLLTLLAPCGALLVPASLAYGTAEGGRAERVRRGALFVAGLLAVLLPLGLAAGAIGALLVVHRTASLLVLGGVLIGLGILQLRGGFRLAPSRLLEQRLTAFQLGLVYAVGGFCSGPLLGGVLTVAAASGQPARAAALLVTFGLGMAVPLFVLAALWRRVRIPRGRSDVVGGVLLIVLGAGFVLFQGGSGLSGIYSDLGITRVGSALEAWFAERGF